MSIASEISRLQSAKADIKEAIENRFVKVGNTKLDGMAQKIAQIPGGIKVSVRVSPSSGKWERPADWPNLDLLPKEDDTLYFTIDNSGRIDDAHFCALFNTITGQYVASVGTVTNGVFTSVRSETKNNNTTFTADLTGCGDYPVVRVTAARGLSNMAFQEYTIGGKTYARRYNAVVEATGKMTKYSGGTYGTYWLERDSRIIGSLNSGTNLKEIWYNCISLQSLDVTGWNTSNWVVTDLQGLWNMCISLQSLDLSSWDTSNWAVTTLSSTWYQCWSLQSLDLSSWNTSNWAVTTMAICWDQCYSLQNLDLSSWDTSNWSVTTMASTWQYCNSLSNLDLSSWNTSNWAVTSFNDFLVSCHSLSSLDISSLDLARLNVAFTFPSRMWQTINFGSANAGKIKVDVNFSNSPLISHATLLALIDCLEVGNHTLTLGSETRARLTSAEIATITETKGWTIA